MSNKESRPVRFLYNTRCGRVVLRPLVSPRVSNASAKVLSSKASKHIVPRFVAKNGIDLDKYVVPEGGFKSFNDFFTRNLNREYCLSDDAKLISPCDGYLTVKRIDEDTVFDVKHSKYRMADLLGDHELAKDFAGGTALIFRLMPNHFHRYCFPSDGSYESNKRIEGKYHCVRPLALSTLPVFIQNTREYSVFNTEHFGKMIQMEVGALLVGKITNHTEHIENRLFNMGVEKGYFEYGGSTIILFLPDEVTINPHIINRTKIGEEIPVEIGEALIQ